MKKIMVLVCMFMFTLISYGGSDGIFYISPGVTFAFNSAGSFSISPKISIGYFFWERSDSYINLTFGGINLTRKKNPDRLKISKYYYIELQGGKKVYGGGIGIAFVKNQDGKTNIHPKLSLCFGVLAYLNLDIISIWPTVNFNLGVQLTTPIPLVNKAWIDEYIWGW